MMGWFANTLAHMPMAVGRVSEGGARWRAEWTAVTQGRGPTNGVRRDEKAIRLARWYDRRRRLVKAKRAARKAANLAKVAFAFNEMFAGTRAP
jgi:hypothetical protein